MVLEHNLSLVNKVNRLLRWGHWFTFFNILLALAITASYWLAEPLPQTGLGWSYLLLNWFGHTAFLCFLFFTLTIFPISLLFPSQKHVRGLGAVLATLALVVLIFDAYVYRSLGYHIGNTSWLQTIELMKLQVVTNTRNFILIVIVTSAVLLALQLTISNYCWKKMARLQAITAGRPIWVFFVVCFVLSHVVHIWADAQLKLDVVRQDNVLPLTYPATAKSFLARYQLLDRQQRQSSQLEPLDSLDRLTPVQTSAYCDAEQNIQPLTILITSPLTASQQQWVAQQGLRTLTPHFAPTEPAEALFHLLHGQFTDSDSYNSLLQTPPLWLQQSQQRIGLQQAQSLTDIQLPWLADFDLPSAPIQIIFEHGIQQNWQQYANQSPLIVFELTSQHRQFTLAPAAAWYRWPALRQQQQYSASMHLDILPTILAAAGCQASPSLVGDSLLQPRNIPKIAISQHEIYSFYKDKLVIIREDHSFGVWSAGTLLPLNEPFDMPMLVDALQRLPKASSTPLPND